MLGKWRRRAALTRVVPVAVLVVAAALGIDRFVLVGRGTFSAAANPACAPPRDRV